MNPGIHIQRIGKDDEFDQVQITLSDEVSSFTFPTYIGHATLPQLAITMEKFEATTPGSLLEFELGSFDPEAAGGAIHTRLQANENGKILFSAYAQGTYFQFGQEYIAREGRAYLVSEPALIDNFIVDMRALARGEINEAILEAAHFDS